MTSRIVALFATLALAQPAPGIAATKRVLLMPLCNGGTAVVELPEQPGQGGQGGDHDCCRKACHAASERRKRLNNIGDCC